MLAALRKPKAEKTKKSQRLQLILLPEALKSFKTQFLFYLRDPIISYYQRLFEKCKTADIKPHSMELFRTFQKKLQEVKTAEAKALWTELKIPGNNKLYELLKVLLIAESMILACVRSEPKEMNLPVPSIEDFIQQMMLYVAKELYGLPTAITVFPGEKEKDVVWKREKLREFVVYGLESAIRKFLPLETILDKYGSVFEVQPDAAASTAPAAAAAPAEESASQDKEDEEEEEEDNEGKKKGAEGSV